MSRRRTNRDRTPENHRGRRRHRRVRADLGRVRCLGPLRPAELAGLAELAELASVHLGSNEGVRPC